MGVVLYEVRNGVAWVTMNRPEQLNAADRAMRTRLTEVFQEIDADDAVRIAILLGAGARAFSAGFDLKEGPVPEAGQRGILGQGALGPAETILRVGKPTIAAIQGYCLGGSLDLALACDLRIASEDARLGAPEARWNLSDGIAAVLLPRIVPLGAAWDLIMRARQLDAQEALDIHLVSEVVSHDRLKARAEELANEIAEQAPLALRAMKALVFEGLHSDLEKVNASQEKFMRLLANTEDATEAFASFRERRPAEWKGR